MTVKEKLLKKMNLRVNVPVKKKGTRELYKSIRTKITTTLLEQKHALSKNLESWK